jgi:hypothetical protein
MLGAKWEQHDFPMKELCRNDEDRLLRVEFFESNKRTNGKLIGIAEFTLKDIISYEKKLFQVFNKRTMMG